MNSSWTVVNLLQTTTEYFATKGLEQPRADAEVLLAHVLRMDRLKLYLNYDRPVAERELSAYREAVRRRVAREPVHYILGSREFWSLDFEVSPAVLIPRPETERLVEAALELVGDHPARVLDVGTGSGAIPIALAHEKPNLQLVAVDISAAALEVARRNARRHKVDDRIRFVQCDLFASLVPEDFPAEESRFDVIVSNPPYVADHEFKLLKPEVADYEPDRALRGGPDGLDVVRGILRNAPNHLNPGGALLIEIGHRHSTILEKELAGNPAYTSPDFIADFIGIRRIIKLLTPA